MKRRQQKSKEEELQIDTDELRAKQSVRTTFKLPERTINLLKISAKHLSIKQKTLLDQLLEDENALKLLAHDAVTHSREEASCRPKTFVLSQKALDQIEDVSGRYEVPRDFLVELSVSRLSSYIDTLADTHAKRRSLLKELDRYGASLDDLFATACSTLEEDDAFLLKLESLVKRARKQVGEIKRTVRQKGDFHY